MAAKLSVALRPMLPSDGRQLAVIFRAAIREIACEDYSPAQCDAWLSAADDETIFGKRLQEQLTLLATLNQQTVGFASLRDNAHLDMLYVQPKLGRRGIATALVDALEILAASRGTALMTTDASDTARDFFARRGYVAMRRNTVVMAGEWLGNTSMEKKLSVPQRGVLQ